MKKRQLFSPSKMTIRDPIQAIGLDPSGLIQRHRHGDWGEVEPDLAKIQNRYVLDTHLESEKVVSIFYWHGNSVIVLTRWREDLNGLETEVGLMDWTIQPHVRFLPGLVFPSAKFLELGVDATPYVFRHVAGDHGGMPRYVARANESAIRLSPEWVASKVISATWWTVRQTAI